MKTFFCLFILIFTSSLAFSDSFKIDSYYYVDTAPKPNDVGSKVVFKIDSEISCQGNLTNKIFVSKDGYSAPPTIYYLTRFWPTYFLRQAALSNAEIELDLGAYDETTDACEVGFAYGGSSQKRWYEPHHFTVSDSEDTNPINKVYYQLFINTSSPTYGGWVYADTDYTVSCDGITTNRIIPSTNPNEAGQTISKEYSSQANPYYSSENTRSFFDLLGGKIESYTVGRYVPELNGCTIYDVQFSGNSISSEAIEIGKQQCIDNPEMCNLFSREELDLAIQMGLDDGMTRCIDSPENCGLFNQADMNSFYSLGIDEGVQDCINHPQNCGLFSQVEVDNAFVNGELMGKDYCKNNPEECELFSQENINEALVTGQSSGIEICKTDPDDCGLYSLENVNSEIDKSVSQAIKQIAINLPKGVLKSICKKQSSSGLCLYYESRKSKHYKHKKYKYKYHRSYKNYIYNHAYEMYKKRKKH